MMKFTILIIASVLAPGFNAAVVQTRPDVQITTFPHFFETDPIVDIQPVPLPQVEVINPCDACFSYMTALIEELTEVSRPEAVVPELPQVELPTDPELPEIGLPEPEVPVIPEIELPETEVARPVPESVPEDLRPLPVPEQPEVEINPIPIPVVPETEVRPLPLPVLPEAETETRPEISIVPLPFYFDN